jgi:hypothetical protein
VKLVVAPLDAPSYLGRVDSRRGDPATAIGRLAFHPLLPFAIPSGVGLTLCWREPNSNHHSLSYELPRTELDRVGRVHADLCRDFFSRAVALELSFFEAAYTSLCAIGKHPHVYYKGAASGMRTCSGRMPIPINRAGIRRRTGKISKSLKNSGGFGRRSLSRTRLMIRL